MRSLEERYYDLYENSPAACFSINVADMSIIMCNKKAEEMSGYSRDEIMKMKAVDLYADTPDGLCKAKECFALFKAGKSIKNAELQMKHKEGHTFWISLSGDPVKDKEGNVLEGRSVALDISERKRAEHLIRVQRDFAQALNTVSTIKDAMTLYLDAAIEGTSFDAGGVYFVDKNTGDLNMVYSRGLSPEFVEAVSHYDADSSNTRLVMAGDPIYIQHLSLNVSMSKAEKNEGLRIMAISPVLYEDRVIACLNVASHTVDEISIFVQDILKAIAYQIDQAVTRLRTEEALKESKERFIQVAESAEEWIWEVDTKGLYIYSSPVVEKILGYKSEELVGNMHFYDLFIPEEKKELTKSAFEIFSRKDVFKNYIIETMDKNGNTVVLETNGFPILDNRGNLLGYRGVNSDITERRKAEEEIKKIKIVSDQSNSGMAIADLQANIQYVNKYFAGVHGYSAKELINKNLAIFHNKEQLKHVEETNKKMLKAGSYSNEEVWHSHKDGTAFPMLMNGMIIKDDSGKPQFMTATAIDITERKQAEEALKKERNRFNLLFEKSPIPFVILHPEKGFLNVNAAAVKLFGFKSKEQLLSLTPDKVSPKHQFNNELTADRLKKNWDEVMKKKYMTFDWIYKDLSGREFICKTTVNLIEVGGEEVLQTAIQDVSKERKAEEALRESEEKYKNIFDTVSTSIVVVDKLCHIIDINPYHVTNIGKGRTTKKNYLGYNILAHPSVVDAGLSDAYKRVLEGAAIDKKDVYFPTLTGGTDGYFDVRGVPLLKDGKVTGAVFVHEDITERKKAEEKLRESEEKYRTLYNNAQVGLYRSRLSDGKMFMVNDRMAKMFGYERSEDCISDFVASEHYVDQGARERLLEIMRRYGKFTNYEALITKRDGSPIWIQYSGTLLPEKDFFEGVATDITERKKAETELSDLNKNLEKIVKERTTRLELVNAELEAFNYSVSHDLRAPLRSMDGFSKALMKRYSASMNAEAQDYLSRIRKGAIRMGSIIDSLLKLSRITMENLELKTVDLSFIAESIVDVLRADEPGRDIEIVIEKGLSARADENLVRVILENLINNAWKFTGKVEKSRIEFGSKKSDGKVIFFITDNGSGFNMEYADKLFTAFQRLHNEKEFPGLGIGLATVQRCVNLHGGRVWAESEQGKGSVFYFVL